MGGVLNLAMSWQWQGKDMDVKRGDFFAIDESFKKSLISDYTPVWHRTIREVFEAYTIRQFEGEGDMGQMDWDSLAPGTVAERKRQGFGGEHPILMRTERLLSSFITGGEEHVEEVSEKEMAWGSANPYALFHQTGTGRGYLQRRLWHNPAKKPAGKLYLKTLGPERGMSQRPILDFLPGWDDPNLKRIQVIFIKEGHKQAKGAGFKVISRTEAAEMDIADIEEIGRIALGAR